MLHLGLALVLALTGSTGWTATQRHRGPEGSPTASSKLTYGHHKLRIEDTDRVVIVDLADGAMTYVDRQSRTWASISLAELVRKRDEKLEELKAKIDELPENLKRQFKEDLERQRALDKKAPELKQTNERDVVSGYACRVVRWTSSDGEGTACVSTEIPVDLSAFQQDVKALGQKLIEVGASGTTASMDFLRLSDDGFPVRTRQQIRLAPGQTVQTETVFEGVQSATVEPSMVSPPDEFQRVSFESLMQSILRRSMSEPEK
ncbi:MAG: DUF4412 domain-containing protein [Myxococcales bacterium]|nr:DUF4412 domain-containing protein [Myxococcales bacterium]